MFKNVSENGDGHSCVFLFIVFSFSFVWASATASATGLRGLLQGGRRKAYVPAAVLRATFPLSAIGLRCNNIFIYFHTYFHIFSFSKLVFGSVRVFDWMALVWSDHFPGGPSGGAVCRSLAVGSRIATPCLPVHLSLGAWLALSRASLSLPTRWKCASQNTPKCADILRHLVGLQTLVLLSQF